MYRVPRTPPPASSSPPPFLDSSPPSSPIQLNLSLSNQATPRQSLTHPLAASIKASKLPREYEKKSVGSIYDDIEQSSNGYTPNKRARHASQPTEFFRSMEVADVFRVTEPLDNRQRSEGIWEEEVDAAWDRQSGKIELSDYGLTHISFRIKDLGLLTILPEKSELANASSNLLTSTSAKARSYSRVATAPAPMVQRKFFRSTSSSATISFGGARDELQFFLAANLIENLPRELFTLTKLTVLSLRQNRLEYIPPEISQLANLQELNLSNNNLRYLPAEINKMKLKRLLIFPNPFINCPSSFQSAQLKDSMITTTLSPVVSEIKRASSVINLTELCLRVLFTRSPTCKEYHIQTYHHLPLPTNWLSRPIPAHIQRDLDACLPQCVNVPHAPQQHRPTALGHCDSPIHGINVSPVFYRHYEECMTWEIAVAGVHLGVKTPLLWRGCGRGCLDHLIPSKEAFSSVEDELQAWNANDGDILVEAFDDDEE